MDTNTVETGIEAVIADLGMRIKHVDHRESSNILIYNFGGGNFSVVAEFKEKEVELEALCICREEDQELMGRFKSLIEKLKSRFNPSTEGEIKPRHAGFECKMIING
jgi:hypothetical protein